MGRVQGNECKKRSGSIHLLVHPIDGFVEKNIGAVAVESFPHAVVKVNVIEVIVVPIIGNAVDMGGREPDSLVKSPVLRSIRIVIAKMPLAEKSGCIANFLENISHRLKGRIHQASAATDIHGTVAHSVQTGQEL